MKSYCVMLFTFMAFTLKAWSEYTDDFITFSSAASFSLKTYNAAKNWDGMLWISTDKTNWTEWNGALVSAAQTGGIYNLYVRGNTSNTKITDDYYSHRWCLAGNDGIACSGNIETLRGATGDDPSPTLMAQHCYEYMFSECTKLTSAPKLPATLLSRECYMCMFYGCSALTNAPALPARTLAEWCYESMFANCVSLTTVPALPAMTLASRCYRCMFERCTKLTTMPVLPAITLAVECYESMFEDCTALEVNKAGPGSEWKIPAVSATAEYWGANMFKGSGGTLQGQPALNTTYYIMSASPTRNNYCVIFSSEASFTLETFNASKNWDGTLWTSTDKTNWTEWNGALVSAAQAGGTYNLYVRGNAINTKITGGCDRQWVFTSNASIVCTGNIEALRGATGSRPSPTQMGSSCYSHMFAGCTPLISAPDLPSTTLTSSCYESMFDGCTSLTNAPMLSAATLAAGCYSSMFSNCTSLTAAPALPATGLADRCYEYMFADCTSLTTVPALPAMTLTDHCYGFMFSGCTSLMDAPELPATTLVAGCYRGMFYGCSALVVNTTTPGKGWKIPVASSTAAYWGADMFTGTGGKLQGWPALNATYYIASALPELNDNCIAFSSSASFTLKTYNTTKNWDGTLWISTDKTIWKEWTGALVTAALAGDTYNLYMSGNIGNTKITGRDYNCRWVLRGVESIVCTGNIEVLRGAKSDAPSPTKMASGCYSAMFQDCTRLTSAPALPAIALASGCYSAMFYGCTRLKSAPSLPATKLEDNCYVYMFQGCTKLTDVPALPATMLAEGCYRQMFSGCTSLPHAPALPATILWYNCYKQMFSGCTALTEAPALSATNLGKYCYEQMFDGCTALTNAPVLPAMTLAEGCYRQMFSGCTSLVVNATAPGKEWKVSAASASGWGYNMFTGTGGTLQGQPALNTTYYIASVLPNPVVPGGEIVVPEGKAEEKATEINGDPTVKAQFLKAPEGVVTTAAYLGCFDAVATSGSTVAFVLNENGTNEVVEATAAVKMATLDKVFSEESTVTIDKPLAGFYYSLRQGGDVLVCDKVDLNKLGGRDTISFELTKGPPQYFYQTLVTPTAVPAK